MRLYPAPLGAGFLSAGKNVEFEFFYQTVYPAPLGAGFLRPVGLTKQEGPFKSKKLLTDGGI